MCRALAAVHAAGLLHRDVKAQNVLRAASGRIVLSDFGTSTELNNSREAGAHRIAGTPLYLAPEVLDGRAHPRGATCMGSACCCLVLTGAFPIAGRTPDEIRKARAAGRPRRLREARPGVPVRLAAIVDRLLDPIASRRFDTAGAVVEALTSWIEAESVPWVRNRPWR